jgi:hypothetical protein
MADGSQARHPLVSRTSGQTIPVASPHILTGHILTVGLAAAPAGGALGRSRSALAGVDVGLEDSPSEGPQGEVAQDWWEVAGAVAAGLGADPARAPVPPGDEGGHRVGDGGGIAQAAGQHQGILEGKGAALSHVG